MHNAIIIEQWRSVKSREITVYVKCHYESVNIRRLDTAGSGTFRFYTIDRRYQIRKQNFCGYATIDRQKFSQLFENTQHISFFSPSSFGISWNNITNGTILAILPREFVIRNFRLRMGHKSLSPTRLILSQTNINQYLLWSRYWDSIIVIIIIIIVVVVIITNIIIIIIDSTRTEDNG